MPNAPLWLMNATFPDSPIFFAKVAFIPVEGIITPRQFGQIRRIRPFRARIARSSSLSGTPGLSEAG